MNPQTTLDLNNALTDTDWRRVLNASFAPTTNLKGVLQPPRYYPLPQLVVV
jgi:hypothetical protein